MQVALLIQFVKGAELCLLDESLSLAIFDRYSFRKIVITMGEDVEFGKTQAKRKALQALWQPTAIDSLLIRKFGRLY